MRFVKINADKPSPLILPASRISRLIDDGEGHCLVHDENGRQVGWIYTCDAEALTREYVPASPGWLVARYDGEGDLYFEPIVAWAMDEGVPSPITLAGKPTDVTSRFAIVFPPEVATASGVYADMPNKASFETRQELLEYFQEDQARRLAA
jgi:hypothetical protein